MGPNGLLNQLTEHVLETALDTEVTEHFGYEKHDAAWLTRHGRRHRQIAKWHQAHHSER